VRFLDAGLICRKEVLALRVDRYSQLGTYRR
jgi:hypothetical protein